MAVSAAGTGSDCRTGAAWLSETAAESAWTGVGPVAGHFGFRLRTGSAAFVRLVTTASAGLLLGRSIDLGAVGSAESRFQCCFPAVRAVK